MACIVAVECFQIRNREYVTEYSAPQWGQKKVLPSGMGPVRGMSAPPYYHAAGAVRLNHPHLDLLRSIAVCLASPPTP
jgi:hypothetical protein